MVGLDRQRRHPVAVTGDRLAPPAVAFPRPGDLAAEAPMDQHGLDGRALGDGLVGRLLQPDELTATVKAVGGDHEGGLESDRRDATAPAPNPEKHGV